MKPTLIAGISGIREYAIDRSRTIDFMGEDAVDCATPMLVRDIEVTCRDLLLEHLDSGEDSVGTRVEIDHLAATLLGMKVAISVTLAELKGRAAVLESFMQGAGNPEKLREAYRRAVPVGWLGKPDDIPGAVLFFASDDADFTTGQVLSVSGGLTMHG